MSVIVEELDNVTFSCRVYGLPLPSIMWLYVLDDEIGMINCSESGVPAFDCMIEENVEGERNLTSTLHLSSVTRSVAGEYICSSSNEVGEEMASDNLTIYCKFTQQQQHVHTHCVMLSSTDHFHFALL